jgi:menaquinone-dependent protoporphyrinogen IX oxidase
MTAGIFYATREGQTRKIAERIAHTLGTYGVEAHLYDVRDSDGPIDWARFDRERDRWESSRAQ